MRYCYHKNCTHSIYQTNHPKQFIILYKTILHMNLRNLLHKIHNIQNLLHLTQAINRFFWFIWIKQIKEIGIKLDFEIFRNDLAHIICMRPKSIWNMVLHCISLYRAAYHTVLNNKGAYENVTLGRILQAIFAFIYECASAGCHIEEQLQVQTEDCHQQMAGPKMQQVRCMLAFYCGKQ